MEEATGSAIVGDLRQPDVGDNATPNSHSAPPPRRRKKDMTPEEWSAAMAFIEAAVDDLMVYMDMKEEDVEDEYRRAGKLHKYDPEMELKKRYARVAKKHPPPAGLVPKMDEYLKLIEDEDED
ncbi:hypothetical protein PVAP13_5NG087062 [Panicum virgatum]|jgi:hypothetical protein|uniref:Uncharacterized protein n=1 Tax=Panicum virgatum TaxID=38727 RepID=A0A8T0RNV7_PANVG|nr:hypothetical protein PVAP13_5NG087200 [Panicum virgatum]KAG2586900.1 hypothetical protein PVAP13_5NG087062 [Panicum virgatum]